VRCKSKLANALVRKAGQPSEICAGLRGGQRAARPAWAPVYSLRRRTCKVSERARTAAKVKTQSTVKAKSHNLKPLSPKIAPFGSIPTPLKPLSPAFKPFKVADQPKESDEPNGDQKPKGSPQGFRQSAQHLPHRRSPFGSFCPNARRSFDLDSLLRRP
jgi:hypothetical protein